MFPKTFRIASLAGLVVCLLALAVKAQPPPPKFSNERFVINAISQLEASEATYHAIHIGSYGSIEDLRNAGLVDAALGSGRKYGYIFNVLAIAPEFVVTATPAVYRKGGLRSFYVNTNGLLRAADKNGQPATADDPVIDGCSLWGIADNERCSISELRIIHSSESLYAATTGNGQFGSLGQLYQAGFISLLLADGVTHQYNFSVTVISSGFQAIATPVQYGTTGFRSFFVDQTGVIRGADHQGQPGTNDDPPI